MNFLDKMKQAGTVAADLEARAEADADRLIARGAELDTKRQQAFAPHFQRMDANHDALDRLEHAFDYLGNGPPQAGTDAGKTPSKPVNDGNAYHGTDGKS